ncbi:MAG: mobile mystery protein A [Bacteroidetes bacterium]|nr:mobile mystery protein A [Bacteroidota bacterium]
MRDLKHKLMIEQLDKKLQVYALLKNVSIPDKGWIHVIRRAYRMSFRQFGERLGITAPSAEGLEKREKEGSITLKSLEEAGRALNMKLVYGFVPMQGSIEKTIEHRARALAFEIVKGTSSTMALEDQEVTNMRLKKAVENKTIQIIYEMPRHLWD